jgi:hypothetical protein
MGDMMIWFIGTDSSKHQKKDIDSTGVNVGLSVDIGANGYLSSNGYITLPEAQQNMEIDYARSRSFGVNLVLRRADIIKDRFYIMPGIGVNWNSYHFQNNINISTANDTTLFSRDSIIDYNKYKLRIAYLELPVVLGTRIGNMDNPVSLQFGVVGGFRLSSIIKQKYDIDDTQTKAKIKDNFNLNPFQVDMIARVGFKDFGVYARYGLTPMFQNGKAPEVTRFSLGITMGGFMPYDKN